MTTDRVRWLSIARPFFKPLKRQFPKFFFWARSSSHNSYSWRVKLCNVHRNQMTEVGKGFTGILCGLWPFLYFKCSASAFCSSDDSRMGVLWFSFPSELPGVEEAYLAPGGGISIAIYPWQILQSASTSGSLPGSQCLPQLIRVPQKSDSAYLWASSSKLKLNFLPPAAKSQYHHLLSFGFHSHASVSLCSYSIFITCLCQHLSLPPLIC